MIGILIYNYFSDKGSVLTPGTNTQNTQLEKVSYVVEKGDSLWKIAEEKMGNGFEWNDLKIANNLSSDTLEVGQKLTIPTESVLSADTKPVDADTYTVVKGDSLWSISVLAYGDGYKWSEIAKLNNLTNPNLIHAGNVLKLPR